MSGQHLGSVGATGIAMASMLGAGLFVALPVAADAAGSWVLAALALAGVVAACNAVSSTRLAAAIPRSGGTYVFGRERLGTGWGVAAGLSFVVGKTASCATMALAVGWYVAPDQPRAVALAALAAVTAVNLLGLERSAAVAVAVAVAVVLVVIAVLLSSTGIAPGPLADGTVPGTIEGAAILFFAFAGYARLATLGGEITNPRSTIPRAVAVAFLVVGALYAATLLTFVHALGSALTTSSAPFLDVLDTGSALRPVVAVTVAVAMLGALLTLMLGVARTASAMADDGVGPRLVARTSRRGVPWVADLLVATAAGLLVATLDVGSAVGLSSACVLTYYAITNLAAWTLGGFTGRMVAAGGLLGCLLLVGGLTLG